MWRDMYRRTALTEDELTVIRSGLTIKGVKLSKLSPKGITIDELYGTLDKASSEWKEGLFTQIYREFANMKDNRKKWIQLDGPMDYNWIENLNSILDDNKKMSLPNGESIKLSDGMCIIIETDQLKNVTPATVSRCGLVYLYREETCDTKAIFN